jgi:hypothetical protein
VSVFCTRISLTHWNKSKVPAILWTDRAHSFTAIIVYFKILFWLEWNRWSQVITSPTLILFPLFSVLPLTLWMKWGILLVLFDDHSLSTKHTIWAVLRGHTHFVFGFCITKLNVRASIQPAQPVWILFYFMYICIYIFMTTGRCTQSSEQARCLSTLAATLCICQIACGNRPVFVVSSLALQKESIVHFFGIFS